MSFGKRVAQLSAERRLLQKVVVTLEHPIESTKVMMAAHSGRHTTPKNRQARRTWIDSTSNGSE